MIMNRLSDAQKINESNSENLKNLMGLVGSLTNERDMLARELEKQTSQNALNRKLRFGGTSLKGITPKKDNKSRDDDKDDFDGTNGTNPNHSIDGGNSVTIEPIELSEEKSDGRKYDNTRTYRMGMKYNKMDAKYKKQHLCDITKLSKIVIFFYDNGSRSRGVLKEFIGDAEISALQSDGYIAYNYIDDQLINIDHICCLAHARAKFKYALEQGCDERAAYFLTRIADLYKLEDEYKKQRLTPDEIRERRNDESTTNILLEISCRLKLLLDDGQPKGDLMQKVLNYLNHFWTQIISYRHDGRYSIDNSIAERCIRPLTRERANSIHYASHKGAETSAIFHTIFSTCKMVGVSALEYLRTFFKAILDGRTDYENLLPSTIGLKH